MHLTLIGGGRAAWAFGISWKRAGWTVDCVALRPGSTSRVPELLSARRASLDETWTSDVVLVAVPDDALADACRSAVAQSGPERWLIHASGAHDSGLFGGRARAFSLHPLRALPPPGEGNGLADTLLVFEGSDEARSLAATIATRFDARLATVARDRKPIYHAAAVIAANLVAAQLDAAARLLRNAVPDIPGVERELAALAESAIANWTARDGAARFTGPIARGDAGLVRAHLAALAGHQDEAGLYRAAGLVLCRRLLCSRPDDASLREIEAILSRPDVP
jgi:predicted short-subunit dehydrogenase-like oxidoreductase (DUF2520 family)